MLEIWCDYGSKGSRNLQEEASLNMIGIRELHEILLFYSIIIITIVLYLTIYTFKKKYIWPYLRHNAVLELLWTVTPGIILVLIGVPSLQLLYHIEEVYRPDLTVKIRGIQWYWNYEISNDIYNISIDSYPISTEDLSKGQFRLLEVDNRLTLPIHTDIRFLVTGEDVIHSWAVPSLGIKIDAIPGRINQIVLFILKEGTFYGQCSELCGIGHPFMPIVIDAVNIYKYSIWLLSNTNILFNTWVKVLLSTREYSY